MASIYKKVAEARARFSGLKIKKTGTNKFAGYDYFELSDILPSCIRICNEVGITPVISFDDGYAVMTVHDTDSIESFTIKSPMAEATLKGCHPIQNLGAVETYSRRYLWFSLFEITEPDALDATTGKDAPKEKTPTPKAPPARKSNENDSKVPSSAVAVSSIWGAVCKHFGWSGDLSDADKEDVKKSAREFLASFGVRNPSKDFITEDTKTRILESLRTEESA